MQSGNIDHKSPREPRGSFLRTGLRNRLAGATAFVFGIVLLVVLIIENRWDNHDTVKPVKALLASIAFIAGGMWYMWRGAKAEPWKKADNFNKDTSTTTAPVSADCTRINLISLAQDEFSRNVEFRDECQRVENELREVAQKMENQEMSDGMSDRGHR